MVIQLCGHTYTFTDNNDEIVIKKVDGLGSLPQGYTNITPKNDSDRKLIYSKQSK